MWGLLCIYLVPYLLAGHETLSDAASSLSHGDAWNEHLLMTVATLGALAIGFLPASEPEFAEAVAVMLLFQVGELFEDYAGRMSRRSIAHLAALRSEVAHVQRGGELVDCAPEAVGVGETIVVHPGERVPIDGVLEAGAGGLDTSALTGESMPREVSVGDAVAAGCVSLSGELHIKTDKPSGESAVAKIIRLVENAAARKSHSEAFITRFARVYTPVVVVCAVLLAVVPPLVSGAFMADFPTWLRRALIFLVVSCPCALVISVPLTFFAGIGGASRRGILVKGANFIDALSQVRTVVFDKTGTLTEGRFQVSAVHPNDVDAKTLLHLAAHVEAHSPHPIAAALRDAYPMPSGDDCTVSEVEELAGMGAKAKVGVQTIAVGNTRLMDAVGAKWHACSQGGTVVHVAIDGIYAGHVVISDRAKAQSNEAVSALRTQGVARIVMLTGDEPSTAAAVAKEVGIDEWFAGLMPQDKVAHVEQLLTEKAADSRLAFVGDGINDAPVLSRADVGIAMGGLGSDAAVEAADVVLMDDNPTKISEAIAMARRTLTIARQNVGGAIGIKIGVLLLASAGLATMWMAVFADVGVTVLAVLNAMRALQIRKTA